MSYGDWAQWKRRWKKLVAEGKGASFRVANIPSSPAAREWAERHDIDFDKPLGLCTALEVAEMIAARR